MVGRKLEERRIGMEEYKEEFITFLDNYDATDEVLNSLKGTTLKSYLEGYNKEPSKLIYHLPVNWQESGDPQYWTILDKKWYLWCKENNLE